MVEVAALAWIAVAAWARRSFPHRCASGEVVVGEFSKQSASEVLLLDVCLPVSALVSQAVSTPNPSKAFEGVSDRRRLLRRCRWLTHRIFARPEGPS